MRHRRNLALGLLLAGSLLWQTETAQAKPGPGWERLRAQPHLKARLARVPRLAASAYFQGRPYQPVPLGLPVSGGVFITLAKAGTDGRLHTRACWGSLRPTAGDLAQVVTTISQAVLTQDYRQPPVGAAELAQGPFVISLLGPLEAVGPGHRLHPQREGLYLTDGSKGAVLLPGEALTAEWQEAACRQKAGIPPHAPVYRYRFRTLAIEEPLP